MRTLGVILIFTLAAACTPWATRTGGVMERVEGELPDYTIAREYESKRHHYPFIRPVHELPPDHFVAYRNLVYRQLGERRLALDLFRPRHGEEPAPAVILVHGGGWRTGDRSHQVPLAQSLAAAGYVGVAVEFRLSREALYPAGIHDIQAAIRWLRQHSGKYGVDPDRIAILGASSGAHMATLIGVTGHLPKFAGVHTRQEGVDSAVQAIINVDGVVDLVSPQARIHEDRPDKISYAGLWLGGRYQQNPHRWQEASPLRHAGPQTPPTLFINSSQARFHVGRDAYIARLSTSGIHTQVHTLPDSPHSFWLFHPWFDPTRNLVIAFLDHVFRAAPANPETTLPEPLGPHRLTILPTPLQRAWHQYLHKSRTLQLRDQLLLERELRATGLDEPRPARDLSPEQKARLGKQENWREWLKAPMLARILSFQTASGGWSKNTDVYSSQRQPGQRFGVEQDYVPTFDNGATFLQIRLLAAAYTRTPDDAVATGLRKAIGLILAAQFPTGGWPQTYPLAGGYHDWTTYNDGVITNVLDLYIDILANPEHFAADDDLVRRIRSSLELAVDNVVADQVVLSDTTGGWGQQHDPIDHHLRSARAFEVTALATMETADLLCALQRIENPKPELQSAIQRGIHWLEQTRIRGKRWQRDNNGPSRLVDDATAPDLWPRFLDANSGKAVFADRDGSIHPSVSTISIERQRGYAWYHSAPARALRGCKD